jgi:hypothetical protein
MERRKKAAFIRLRDTRYRVECQRVEEKRSLSSGITSPSPDISGEGDIRG